MKTKRIRFGTTPANPQHINEPAFSARLKRARAGIEVQTWGIAADRTLVYAGVHRVPELTAKWLFRLHRNNRRWRAWYDRLPGNRGRDYPAKHDPGVAFAGMHPVTEPAKTIWIKL